LKKTIVVLVKDVDNNDGDMSAYNCTRI